VFGGLDEKCEQALTALGQLAEKDFSKAIVRREETHFRRSFFVSFSDGVSQSELQNSVTLLVANIASLKDHLKKWCNANGSNFNAETVLNTCREAALIHDLWNSDKHGGLDRAPRSGVTPQITDLRKALRLTSGTTAGSGAFFTMDPRTGEMQVGGTGGGSATHTVTARIVDEHGNHLGELEDICKAALDAWIAAMNVAGVPQP
jgi:hypothetical protein